jgi:hypothetical protein
VLAAEFHFQPGALWEMDTAELRFWADRRNEIIEQQKAG